MSRPKRRKTRPRGTIERLPSGALRVKVYAGIDPLTKRRHDVIETVPAGERAEQQAEKVLARLINDVNERRNARTNATVDELFMRYFEVVHLAPSSLRRDMQNYENHIKPVFGSTRAGTVDGHMLDMFYAALRRCRERCGGRKRGHSCVGLAPSTVRRIHFLLSAAFGCAV